MAREADRIVVLSREMGAELAAAVPAAAEKIAVIHSIVDLEKFAPSSGPDRDSARNRLGIKADDFAIGCIGAIREKKGQAAFVQNALPVIFENNPNAHVHFIGDNGAPSHPYWTEFSQAASTSELSSGISIHGHCDDVHRWYRALDLILIPANYEGLARAMIEGMACGVPIVSTDVCSAREMLDETGAGLVVEKGDWSAMIAAVDRMKDPAFRKACEASGRAVADRLFDETGIAKQVQQLYEQVHRDSGEARRDGQ
ncbi:D-inositol 3-phosphate glycosyltransferase [Alteripontixanthobacter maritimus]|uniref:D-inositol 3-phosphate glycosyltransferase n=2 Tax=Alteripontixanthobacter maritimus TaxID=2161824 RepID=A0A369Q923_9SPHN|nr:D-inositol 3-phosphate glycosyltransferase [Alteripontixanthobacter maritimus]